MKKLIVLCAGVLLAVGAYAQAAGPTGGGVQTGGVQAPGKGQAAKGGHAPVGEKLLKQLNLSPDQMKQIKALVTSFREKRQQEVQAKTPVNRKANAAMRQEFMQDLAKILTPEQRDKLKALMEEAKKKNKQKLTGALGGGTATG